MKNQSNLGNACMELDFGKMCVGTDCQTKSAYLLPMQVLSITVYRTMYEQTKPYQPISYLHCHIDTSKQCENYKNISLNVSVAEWLEVEHWKARGRWLDSRCWAYIFFLKFSLVSRCSQTRRSPYK